MDDVAKKILIILFLIFFTPTYSQTGVNTLFPKSTLDINGNISLKVVNLNGSSSPTPISDGVYISLNPQAQDQVFSLPSAAEYPGRMYFLRNVNANFTAAVSTSNGIFYYKNSSNEINPATHSFYLYEGLRSVIIISDGTNWTVFN